MASRTDTDTYTGEAGLKIYLCNFIGTISKFSSYSTQQKIHTFMHIVPAEKISQKTNLTGLNMKRHIKLKNPTCHRTYVQVNNDPRKSLKKNVRHMPTTATFL